MKKQALFLLLCLLSVGNAYAFDPPLDNDSARPIDIKNVGVKVLTVGHTVSSGFVRGSSVAIYGVLTSTARPGVGSFAMIRSTDLATAGTAFILTPNIGELLVPMINIASTTRNTFIEFNPPIIAPEGFSLEVSSIGTMASVFYQFLSTGDRQRYIIPRDNRDGAKTYSMSLVGLKVSSTVTPGAGRGDGLGTETLDETSAAQDVDGSTSVKRMFVYGWMASSGANTNFIVLEDTETAITDVEDYLPSIFYNAMTMEHALSDASTQSKVWYFPWPVIFERGIRQRRNQANDSFRLFTRPANMVY